MIRRVVEMGSVLQVNEGLIQNLRLRYNPENLQQFSASIESRCQTGVPVQTPMKIAQYSELASQTSGDACGGGSHTGATEEKYGTFTLLASDSRRAGVLGEPSGGYYPGNLQQFSASIESRDQTDVRVQTPMKIPQYSELASQTSGHACGGGSHTGATEENHGTLTLLAPESRRAGVPVEPSGGHYPENLQQFSASIESRGQTGVPVQTPMKIAQYSELASQTSGNACGGGSHTGATEEKHGTLTLLAPDSKRAGVPGEPSSGSAGIGKKSTESEPGASSLTRTQKRNLKKRQKRTLQSIAGGDSSILKGVGRGTKRPLSSGSAFAHKLVRKDTQPGSLASMRMAIVKDNYPEVRMSEENVLTVEHAILERMDAIPVDDLFLEVLSTSFWKGAVIVKCGNPTTVDWIRNTFDGNREVMDGEALRVMNANDLPKPCKVAFKTKETHTQDPCILLRRLRRLNRGLNTEHWRTLDLLKEPPTFRWIFEVEPQDVEAIRRLNYGAFSGIDRGVFKVLSEKKTD